MKTIERGLVAQLLKRLQAGHQPIQIVLGPRQVGKTTAVEQVIAQWTGPSHYATADLPAPPDAAWVQTQWAIARQQARAQRKRTLLVLDEVQKIPRWSEVTKALYDEDKRAKSLVRVVLLGSLLAPRRAGRPGEPRRPARDPLLPALDVPRVQERLRLVARRVALLGRLPGRGAAGEGAGAVAEVHLRLADRVRALARHPPAHAGDEAGADAAALHARGELAGAGARVQQDARAAPGRGEHRHPRALPRAPLRRVPRLGLEPLGRRDDPAAGLEPEADQLEQRPRHRAHREDLRRGEAGRRVLGAARRERGRRALPQPRPRPADLVLAAGQRRGRLRRSTTAGASPRSR